MFSWCQPTYENSFPSLWHVIIIQQNSKTSWLCCILPSPSRSESLYCEGADQTHEPGADQIQFHFFKFFFTKACTYFLTSTIQSPYRGLPILVWRWGTEWADSRAYDFHCRVQLVCSIWPLVFGEDAQHHYQKLALKHAWCHWGSIITAWRWFCVGLGEFPCFLLLEATTCIHMLIDHNVFIICENLILN